MKDISPASYFPSPGTPAGINNYNYPGKYHQGFLSGRRRKIHDPGPFGLAQKAGSPRDPAFNENPSFSARRKGEFLGIP